jgi:hypothetical protein
LTEFSTQGSSEAILRRTDDNFSFDTRLVRALDARTRTRKLLWVEHLLIHGIKRKGSSSSPLSPAIDEGFSLDKRIRIGYKLGWRLFPLIDSKSPEDVGPRNSVATSSSLKRNECSDGYLGTTKKLSSV